MTGDLPPQKVREEYDAACRELAEASAKLKDAQEKYDTAFDRYNIAYGAAKFARIL